MELEEKNWRPDFASPMEATRVSTFMDPEQVGRWHLNIFERTEEDVRKNLLAVEIEHRLRPERLALAQARVIPAGTYISLRRRMTDIERRDFAENELGSLLPILAEQKGVSIEQAVLDFIPDEHAWIPVMSDTPAEIEGHRHAIEEARGHVVITGLGLGCLVSALIEKPDVESITVVEIDPDVLALTGPYYEWHPKVTIVQSDALSFARKTARTPGALVRFDYAWHDIWSHISARNLFDDRIAEHGISYITMFEAYAPLMATDGQQAAWALEEAQEMDRHQRMDRERELAKVAHLRTLTLDERVEFIVQEAARAKLGSLDIKLDDLPPQMRAVFDPPGLRDHLRTVLSDENLPEIEAGYLAKLDEPDDPLGDPNAHLKGVDTTNA